MHVHSEGLLKFISKMSPTHKFVKNDEGKMVLDKIDCKCEDREAILDSILSFKIHFTIGHSKVTYETLLALFNPKFLWLTASKLHKHVSISCRFLSINTCNGLLQAQPANKHTWFKELPLEDKEIKLSENQTDAKGNSNIAGQNHRSVFPNSQGDDYIENHGLACTCCRGCSDLVNATAIAEMKKL